MAKGMFTQGVSILLERAVALDEMETALAGFDVRGRRDGAGDWAFGGPTLIVAYRPDANGMVAVDVVDRPWPDHMGDPDKEPMVFGAWTMGNFGPFAFPDGLARASQQSWTWPEGPAVAERHKAFLRIRSSYAFGAGDDDKVLPEDYEALSELQFVTELASALLDVPGALCYFNPNGEVLWSRDGLRGSLEFGREHQLPPLNAWSNVRMFNIDAEWCLMDTVGNAQLDLPDIECCLHTLSYDLNEVGQLVRNLTLHVLEKGELIADGDTMEGPGEVTWQCRSFENGLADPPRRALRCVPLDGRPVPAGVLEADTDT